MSDTKDDAIDHITIIEGNPKADHYVGLYCKRYDINGNSVALNKPTKHSVASFPLNGLGDLFKLLRRQTHHRKRCVIRGTLAEEARERGGPFSRTLVDFDDTPHHWVAFDLDGVPLPEAATNGGSMCWRAHPDELIRWVIKTYFPSELHDAAVIWRYSSSMALKPGLRVHLWFWLDTPKTSAEVKIWVFTHGWEDTQPDDDGPGKRRLRPTIPVDVSLYNPVQPHITADPQLSRGLMDPVPRRMGMIEGGPADLIEGDFELPEKIAEALAAGIPDTSSADGKILVDRVKARRNSPIGFVNRYIDIHEALEMAGYIRTRGGRYLYPYSETGTPGVVVKDGHCFSHHDGDPLEGVWSDSYDVLTKCGREQGSIVDITEEAYQLAFDRAMARMNSIHAVVSTGGQVKIAHERTDAMGHHSVGLVGTDAFQILWKSHVFYEPNRTFDENGNDIVVPEPRKPAQTWLHWDARREYPGGIVMVPDDDFATKRPDVLNTWRGLPLKPRKGDWSLFRRLVVEVICDGHDDLAEWLLDWMAAMVQMPAVRFGTAVVLRGKRGIGKGEFGRVLRTLMGQYAMQLTSIDRVIGQFNSLFEGRILVHADEAVWGGDRRHEGVLRGLVTEETLELERKGIDCVIVPNFLRFLISTNETWAVPAGDNERRWLVLDVNDKLHGDFAFFKALREQMYGDDNAGCRALLQHLLTREITTNQRIAPKTAALMELNEMNMNMTLSWLYEAAHSGEWLTGLQSSSTPFTPETYSKMDDTGRWPVCATPQALLLDLGMYLRKNNGVRRYGWGALPTTVKLIRDIKALLREVNVDALRTTARMNGETINVYRLPTVEQLRAAIENRHGFAERGIDWLAPRHELDGEQVVDEAEAMELGHTDFDFDDKGGGFLSFIDGEPADNADFW